jgi:glycosyltransferase involved in cell wall biosynthesis
MRIVIADPAGYTPPYDHSLSAALARRGHPVDLLTCPSRFGPLPEPAGFRRHEVFFPLTGRLFRRAPRSPLRYVVKAIEYAPSVGRLLQRIDSLEPDVVHLQWPVLPRLDVHWLGRLGSGRALVLTAHETLPRRPRDLGAWTEIVRRVDRVVVHSPSAAAALSELGVDRGRVKCIRHPVFQQAIAPPAPRGTTLLFFGLLRWYKGLDVLVSALHLVARRVPQLHTVIAGDPVGPIDHIRKLADRLGVAGRIEWRLGFLPESEVSSLMQAATIVVLPYRSVDASGVLATALGYHRPVVVSDIGSMGDLVREFEAGFAVPPGNPAEVAAACTALLTNATVLERAYRGAQAAAAALTWDDGARAHEEVYQCVLAELAGQRKAAVGCC